MNDKSVPPAGGEVEVLGWVFIDGSQPSIDWYLDKLATVREGTELVDRAHVTRLTADNAQLQAEARDLRILSDDQRLNLKRKTREYIAMKGERDALQSELTKAREAVKTNHEPVAFQWRRKTVVEGSLWSRWVDCTSEDYNAIVASPGPSDRGIIREGRKLYRHPPRKVVMPEKYDDVLLPFLAMMRAELHANAHKGDRPGWLSMDRKTAVLEVFYHMGKLHQAVHRGEAPSIREYAADVANMCMMLTDVCGCLDEFARLNK